MKGSDQLAMCTNSPGSFACAGCVDSEACCKAASARTRGPAYGGTTLCADTEPTVFCTANACNEDGCTGVADPALSILRISSGGVSGGPVAAGRELLLEVEPLDSNGRKSFENGVTDASIFVAASEGMTIPALQASADGCKYTVTFSHETMGGHPFSIEISGTAISQVQPASIITITAAQLSVGDSTLLPFGTDTVAGRANVVAAVPRDR